MVVRIREVRGYALGLCSCASRLRCTVKSWAWIIRGTSDSESNDDSNMDVAGHTLLPNSEIQSFRSLLGVHCSQPSLTALCWPSHPTNSNPKPIPIKSVSSRARFRTTIQGLAAPNNQMTMVSGEQSSASSYRLARSS